MDQIETRTDGGATHGTVPGRDAGLADGDAASLALVEGSGVVTYATLDWVCEFCRRHNRHDLAQDGKAKQVNCAQCRNVGGFLVPAGPAMRAPLFPADADVVCADCGTRSPAATHGCRVCDGLGPVEIADGRCVSRGSSRAFEADRTIGGGL